MRRGLAANRNVIAAAITILHSDAKDDPWNKIFDIFVVFFDAKTGVFLSRRGPWLSGSGSTLDSTADGHFLLLLTHYNRKARVSTGDLRLLSSSGEEIGNIVVSPFGKLLISPSGRTLMLEGRETNEIHFAVLDAETLQKQNDWTEASEKEAPFVTEISDKQMLGVSRNPENYFVRDFKGLWQPLPRSHGEDVRGRSGLYWRTDPQFLSDDAIIVHLPDETGIVSAIESSGKIRSQYTLPKVRDYNSVLGTHKNAASQDARYFALWLIHENNLTHWWDHTMDMSPLGAEYFIYVWDINRQTPITKIKVGPIGSNYSFVPGDAPGIAVADRGKVKLIRLPSAQPK